MAGMEARTQGAYRMSLVWSVLSVVIVSVLLGLAGREAWAWLPRLSRVVIVLGTALLPERRRQIRREEWIAEPRG